MAIAQCPHAREIAIGRHEDAVRADDCFEEDRGDRVRPLDHEHIRKMFECALGFLGGVPRVER